MKKILLAITLVAVIICLSGVTVDAQNISLTITGIKSTKGQIIVSVFKDNESFKKERPVSTFPFPKTAVVNGVLKVKITLEPGIYGLAMLDDQNNSGRMEKNIFQIPKEGFGFSNFYLSGMSRPVFNDFKFEVKNALVTIESKLRYL